MRPGAKSEVLSVPSLSRQKRSSSVPVRFASQEPTKQKARSALPPHSSLCSLVRTIPGVPLSGSDIGRWEAEAEEYVVVGVVRQCRSVCRWASSTSMTSRRTLSRRWLPPSEVLNTTRERFLCVYPIPHRLSSHPLLSDMRNRLLRGGLLIVRSDVGHHPMPMHMDLPLSTSAVSAPQAWCVGQTN